MRYKLPKDGETRVRKKFFWLPAQLPNSSGDIVCIWLESAYVKEVYWRWCDCWIDCKLIDDCEKDNKER